MNQYETEHKHEQDTLEKFISCIEKNDSENIAAAWQEVRALPRLHDYDDTEKGIICKADFLNDKRLLPTAENEKMHRYISKFFDLAVNESMEMRVIESWEDAHLRELSGYSREGYIDYCKSSGNTGINKWMQAYKSLSAEFSTQGKEIFIPESFMRYSELEKFAFNTIHYPNGKLAYEKLSDGTEREWYENDAPKSERQPDGTEIRYDRQHKVIYHATKGEEDTVVYLAKQRLEASRKKGLEQIKDQPRIVRKIATAIADSKAFNNIAFKRAVKKVKSDIYK